MSTSVIAPTVTSELELAPPIVINRQFEDLGITIEQYHLTPNDVEFSPLPTHAITWNIGEPGDLVKLEGKRSQRVWMAQGGMTLTPSGQSRHWCWNHSTDVLLLQLQPQLISQVVIASEIDINQIELVNRFGIYDPQMEWIGKSLLAEMQSNRLAGKLYTESLIDLLVIHLLRQHSAFGQSAASSSADAPNVVTASLTLSLKTDTRQFSPSRLKRVLEYIHDNLEQNLSLVDLATLANLSPSRFTRVFRQETGLSPHQYLIQARIERAKHLLRSGSEVSIGRVAHQVGFADQSHFTRHFKRIVGVTPKVILQDSRNVLNHSPNVQ
jgi:AraC family transcriptional regulator